MNEYSRAATWLAETLAGIPGSSGVHEHPGPSAMTYPAVTFQLQAPDDLVVVGEDRVWAELLFLVTAVTKGQSTLALQAIADAIDDRLHGTDGAAGDDAVVISSTRDSLFHAPSSPDGVSYRRLGGFYRLLVQPAVI